MALAAALLGLGKSALTAAPVIEAAVSQGLSRSATQSLLKSTGIGIRRQNMLDLYRYFQGGELLARQWKNMRKDFIPNPLRMREAINPIRRLYSYKIAFPVLGAQAGEPETQFITVASDNLLTPAQAEQTAQEYIDSGAWYHHKKYGVAVLEDILIAGPGGTLQ